ncbi:MAG: peptide-methionine (S)-S-oxide reductase [Pelagibacterales bacterium]|nr:peptide-methionine (S)-S-oxide reductase [Pelagibacterales bacterium]
MKRAIFAGGCFWCTEAIFIKLDGVIKVTSGYIGGEIEYPSYQQICEGNTGHVEAVEIIFNDKIINYKSLLKVFFDTHDPTQFDGQGNDIGSQYLSRIYFVDEDQKELAKEYIEDIAKNYDSPIVTKLYSEKAFYEAEQYHQNYYNENPEQPYCQIVIKPKLNKFNNAFKNFLKK